MDSLLVHSKKGDYTVHFYPETEAFSFEDRLLQGSHFMIDARVAEHHQGQLAGILKSPSVLMIEATEDNKSLTALPAYIDHLIQRDIRKDHRLIAIGGGILHDITSFIAGVLFRGMPWIYCPTTLLSAADACIGGKGSLNAGKVKNIIGTFSPPKQILIYTAFLKTLSPQAMYSGVGEIIKIYALEGRFDEIALRYESLLNDKSILLDCIYQALKMKKAIVEQDEFDLGIRNLLNYGHTFGHAIEVATNYKIPHGVAITIGMDMANYVAYQLGVSSQELYLKMNPLLKKNYQIVDTSGINFEVFFAALKSDKKNKEGKIGLILPNQQNRMQLTPVAFDHRLYCAVEDYFKKQCLI